MLKEELEKHVVVLRQFARWVLEQTQDCMDLESSDAWEMAIDLGLVELFEREDDDENLDAYRFTEIIHGRQ